MNFEILKKMPKLKDWNVNEEIESQKRFDSEFEKINNEKLTELEREEKKEALRKKRTEDRCNRTKSYEKACDKIEKEFWEDFAKEYNLNKNKLKLMRDHIDDEFESCYDPDYDAFTYSIRESAERVIELLKLLDNLAKYDKVEVKC